MTSERRERVQVERDEGFERSRKVIAYSPSLRVVLLSRVSQLIWLIAAVIDVLVALRFALKLIAANPASSFASFIYSITDILVGPFTGLVRTPTTQNGMVFDVASLFAVVVYTLLAFIIVQLLHILFGGTGSTRRVTTFERRN
jgi:uncharacterized protein YggT (Ycf19 family)